MPKPMTPQRIEQEMRKAEALQLRVEGMPVVEIAQRMGRDRSTVHSWIRKAVKDAVRAPAETVVALELQRLDEMQVGAWKSAKTGDHRAIDSVLKIMNHRAKLLGLFKTDAPDQSGDAVKMLVAFMDTVRGSVDGDV